MEQACQQPCYAYPHLNPNQRMFRGMLFLCALTEQGSIALAQMSTQYEIGLQLMAG